MIEETLVTFPAGGLTGTSTVAEILDVRGGVGLVVSETPFHPLDHTWPDQPADLGTVTVGPHQYRVLDCVTGAQDTATGAVELDEEITARRGDTARSWFVLHIVEAEPGDIELGEEILLEVDGERRSALSAGHTACHLVALALNEALGDRWRKDVPTDSLGNPNFDRLAIISSKIREFGSRDEYRLGKSLRKKGFTVDGLEEALPAVTARINERLAGWIAQDAKAWIDAPTPALTAARTWHCALPESEASVLCGGTHLATTKDLCRVTVTLELSEAALIVTTEVEGG
jgi:alanyl-tRNA synthetase